MGMKELEAGRMGLCSGVSFIMMESVFQVETCA